MKGLVRDGGRLASRCRRHDLTLLLDVDVPWVGDSVRYFPEERRSFFDRMRATLEELGRPYTLIRGSWEERWAAAREAVGALPSGSARSKPGRV